MNKKLIKKYLDIAVEDASSGRYYDPRSASGHDCHAKPGNCPKEKQAARQMELNLDGTSQLQSNEYSNYLKDYERWAMSQTNTKVISDAMHKHADNPDIIKILDKASDALFKKHAEEYFDSLGERL